MTENTSEKKTASKRSKMSTLLVRGLAVGLGVAGLATGGYMAYQATAEPATISSELFSDQDVNFDKQPEIRVQNGTIESVSVKPVDGGDRVTGSTRDDGSEYQLDTADLHFATKYRVTTKAVNRNGDEVVQKNTFRTFAPTRTMTSTTNVEDGATYGAGMPITIHFSNPVTNKAEIEKHLKVSTDASDEVVGCWSWQNDYTVSYRPKEYWPANTTVKVDGSIKGVRAGGGTAPGASIDRTFKIGALDVMVIDSNTHQMKFKKNGKLIRTIPVSMGRPGDETRSGTKLIMSREHDIEFDAGTLGVSKDDPDYYKLKVDYAMRITASGEFIHTSNFSADAQGHYNVSHGCTNVSTANGAWLYEHTHVGDIVEVKNTHRQTEPGNGVTVWDESWSKWKSGSAL